MKDRGPLTTVLALAAFQWPSAAVFAQEIHFSPEERLDAILEFMLGTILRLDTEQARVIAAKLGTNPCLQLCNDCLTQTEWSEDVKDQVAHFLKAMSICADNRNVLMHSRVAWRFGDQTVLFKKSRSGDDLTLSTTLEELRQVADEMNCYCTYGRQLANAINNASGVIPVFPASAYPWPVRRF
jgi:hypothetical protein